MAVGGVAASWKLVSILAHMGTPTTRKTKRIQPSVYCSTSLFAVPRGSSGWAVGRKPCGHRGAGRTQDMTTTRLLSRWAGGLLSHTPGRVGWERGLGDGGNNNISGDTNKQEDPACYNISKAAVKSLCFPFPVSKI